MNFEPIIDTELETWVDAGKAPLDNYLFVSPELEEKHQGLMLMDSASDAEKYALLRINQTGNILFVLTSPELTIRTKKLFASVAALFAAMSSAMNQSGRSLFDYEAWRSLVGKSGFFVEVQKNRNLLTIKNSGVNVNTQIIQQLIPGLSSGSAMAIANGVLSAVKGEFQATERDENAKRGHLLFICEELYGAPSVTVRLFYASKKSHCALFQPPCDKSVNATFEQLQEAHTFLFVSPDTIAEYATLFTAQPARYKNLIERFKKMVKEK